MITTAITISKVLLTLLNVIFIVVLSHSIPKQSATNADAFVPPPVPHCKKNRVSPSSFQKPSSWTRGSSFTSRRHYPLLTASRRQNSSTTRRKEPQEDAAKKGNAPKVSKDAQLISEERNWIEKTSPMGIGKLMPGTTDITASSGTPFSTQSGHSILESSGCRTQNREEHSTIQRKKDVTIDGNYDLGIHGLSLQTGPLSLRMYNTLLSVASKRFPQGMKFPPELAIVYKLYAMEMTAREAVKAALGQNGLELAIGNLEDGQNTWQQEEQAMWGDFDTIQFVADHENHSTTGEIHDSFDSAVVKGDWEPGQSFSFVVRNVPAKRKGYDISKVLASLDGDGMYCKDSNSNVGAMHGKRDVVTLKEVGIENERRSDVVPDELNDGSSPYIGDGTKGYEMIQRSDLLPHARNYDGSENSAILEHVMDCLISHGCLVVDITDGGMTYKHAHKIANMWHATQSFFDTIQNVTNVKSMLPGMKPADGTTSPHAVVGYATYEDGAMKFLEIRIVEKDLKDSDNGRSIIPHEAEDILGHHSTQYIMEAFDVLADVGKDIVRVAVAAVNTQYDAFESSRNEAYAQLCSHAAELLCHELIDDSKPIEKSPHQKGVVSMSPHRFCRYEGVTFSGTNKNALSESKKQTEIFGAHTDTSFMTIVPVAAISGLEIFDTDAGKWLRPELLARASWENDQAKRGADPSANTESIRLFNGQEAMDVEIPWHCRYVVAMPGDLLQVATRNEICSAVHRVVCVNGEEARLSCPVLLRARSDAVMDASRYFGSNEQSWGPLIQESDGMTMDDIHNALQPFNYL